jgi:hypothetical protein
MKIEIYRDEKLLNMDDVYITDFDEGVESYSAFNLDFSSIGLLKGEKIIIEKAFQDELSELLND